MTEARRRKTEDGRRKAARLLSVLCLLSSVLWLVAGCDGSDGLTKGVRIGELAPAGRGAPDLSGRFLRMTNIDVITYELPAEKIADINGVWQILDSKMLRYNDPGGFIANGLAAAAGRFADTVKIAEILKSINAKKLSTTSLLIQNGQVEVLELGRMPHKTAFSYIGRSDKVETVEVGPAILGLQVYARQIAVGRAGPKESRIQITPAVVVSTQGLPPELAAKMQESDVRVYSAGFGLNVRPGNIIVLAPAPEKIADTATAAGRFLTKAGPEPTVRVLLFICTSIT